MSPLIVSWAAPGPGRCTADFLLPGCVYLYQGDELGLWEVEDIPDELLQDPFWERSRHTDRGRDGCRGPAALGGGRTAVRLRAG